MKMISRCVFICILKYQLEASKCTQYGAFSFRDVIGLGSFRDSPA